MPPIYVYIPTLDGPRMPTPDERAVIDAFVVAYLARTARPPEGHKKVPGVGHCLFTTEQLRRE